MKNIFKKINKIKLKKEKGVALLFTILVMSVLLLVAIGISNISYREAVFTREARDSDVAFFASDTGLECAMYWDLFPVIGTAYKFPHTIPSTTSIPGTFGTTVSCDTVMATNVNYIGNGTSGGGSPDPMYSIVVGNGDVCAMVTVEKNVMVGATSTTLVTSYGYNMDHSSTAPGGYSCLNGTESNTRVVTRALSTQYPNP